MRALVTGGSGFIGSHVVDQLVDHGIVPRIFDMVQPTFRTDVEYYHGSILDLDAVTMAMNQVDAVFHLAAVADVNEVAADPHYAESINVRGTINVLEAMRKTKGVRRIVYGNTTWVYSDAEGDVVDEDTLIPPPSNFYTSTKLAAENYCIAYSRQFGIDATILRYGIPYGPRARPAAVIPAFVERALAGEPLTIQGDGSQFRQFVYVEDLARGNVMALKSIAKNRVYNLDGNERVTIRQIAESVRDIIGDVDVQFGEPRPGDFSGKVVSSERALKELGWAPEVSFEDGLRRYIDWYREVRSRKETEWAAVDAGLAADGVTAGAFARMAPK